MKKSIKYAGIAAATLLAVAPVAAPVVSSTTNVQADTISDDQSVQNAAVTAFGNQFKDQAATDLYTKASEGTAASLKKVSLGTSNITLGTDSDADQGFNTVNSSLVTGTATTDAQNKSLNSKGTATVKVSATYGGVAVKDNADLLKVLSDSTYPEVVFTITLTYNNMNGVSQTKTYTETATRSTTESQMTTANVSFTSPLSVPLNSTTTSTVLNASNDATIKDQNDNSVLTNSDNVTAVDKFYDTYSAAINSITDDTLATTATTNVGSNADVNNDQESFLKAGTYYQVITFDAADSSSLGDFLTAYKSNPSTYAVYVNGQKASAGYNFVQDKDNANKVSFVRAINVSNSAEKWTVTDNKGVVTTKSDNAYYTLKNDDNATITNRALAKNTAWVTDQKRVDQDGNTQYRVATGEWIDANNVTFSDKATTDEGEYTDVQALNGKVTLDGPSSFIYMLYNDNGETVSNRALAGDSAWYTDKKATNAAGVTVYHVATGEWVQAGSGVNYVAY
ncbi:hypothetical protein NBRC111452_1385 [Companilactobacillus farciminis]|nr:hypothetical protein NBRC111452_1385 [Companilactobacillus farciminis]